MGSANFGFGSGDIAFDDVQCSGSEMTLLQCNTSTDHNCNHYEDAGVVCGMNIVDLSSLFNTPCL